MEQTVRRTHLPSFLHASHHRPELVRGSADPVGEEKPELFRPTAYGPSLRDDADEIDAIYPLRARMAKAETNYAAAFQLKGCGAVSAAAASASLRAA